MTLMNTTEVSRVLTGSGDKGKAAGLTTLLKGMEMERPFEIRKTDSFHDRFVLPNSGPVWMLGTSMTGLGRRLALMVEIEDETVSAMLRERFEQAWEAADVVGTA